MPSGFSIVPDVTTTAAPTFRVVRQFLPEIRLPSYRAISVFILVQ